jgi:carbamoyl-phosphate synthase small subunit
VALALGMRTFKLSFGHRGANHPVRECGSSRVLVTAQNDGYAVEASDAAEVSHLSLNDATVEGLESEDITTLQFHPEAAPGPLDALPFFDRIAAACRSAPTFAAS